MTINLPDVDDETWPEDLYPAAEQHFAGWITSMNGWVMAETVASSAGYQAVAARWLADGRLTTRRRDRFDTVELTDAGRVWCREHGRAA